MKLSTVKLLVPIVAVTIRQLGIDGHSALPRHMRIPVALIGSLISLGPIFALMARLPIGMLYNRDRARWLVSAAIIAMGLTNYCYSFAESSCSFAVVHCLNGFAYSAVTTLYMAFFVDSLAPEENRNHAIGYYVGCLAAGYSTGNFFGGLIADLGLLLTFPGACCLGRRGAPMVFTWAEQRCAGFGQN
jgi:predicted MFS family arabinose efflux permease